MNGEGGGRRCELSLMKAQTVGGGSRGRVKGEGGGGGGVGEAAGSTVGLDNLRPYSMIQKIHYHDVKCFMSSVLSTV